MNFCSQCGNAVTSRIPAGDTRPRYVCGTCETIHYENPRIVTGCLPCHEDRILLCKRAIEPRLGTWTLPAGFLENGETTHQGALREMAEEANARADVLGLYTMFDLPHINQVYMFFRVQLTDLDFSPGAESEAVRLFGRNEIPWNELAFPVVYDTIEFYYADFETGVFPFRSRDILYRPGRG